MPVEAFLVLLVAAVLANTILMAVIIVPALFRRGELLGSGPGSDEGADDAIGRAEGFGLEPDAEEKDLVGLLDRARNAYDRVVRIVAWVFILTTSLIVAVTGLWPDTQVAIFILLAAGGVFVLVVHEIVPSASAGPLRHISEGLVALGFVTGLVLLTGQAASPFFFAYPLVVAGIALVAPVPVTIFLSFVAGAAYVGTIVVGGAFPIETAAVAQVAVNVIAVQLLAFVAAAVAAQHRRTRDAAIRASTTDSLTGLFNRGFLVSAMEREIARSARTNREFSLLLLDLDGLKTINDRFGHHQGDRILRGVATVIRTTARKSDTPARQGGDEFSVLLPETDVVGGAILAEKIREGVSRLIIDSGGFRLAASVSIGVVSYPSDGRTVEELMMSGDQAMYGAKRRGKNQVVAVGIGGRRGSGGAGGANGAGAGAGGAGAGGGAGAAGSASPETAGDRGGVERSAAVPGPAQPLPLFIVDARDARAR